MAPGLKYGLIAATGMGGWMLGEYAFGLHTTRISLAHYTSWGTEVILIIALWRLLNHHTNAVGRYWLPVWEGLMHGIVASVVAAMGFYVIFSLYVNFLHPDFPDLYLDWSVAHMRALGTPEVEIREAAHAFRWSMGPVGLPLTILGQYLLVGLIASPVLTLWLNWRRKEPVHRG